MCSWHACSPSCLQEKKIGMDSLAITPAALAETLSLIDEGVISGKIAKDVLPRLLEGEGNSGVRAFVEAQGLVQISGRGRWTADNGDRMHDTYCHPLGVTWDQWQTVHLGRWSVSSCIASLLDTCYIQHRRALGHVRIDASCRMWARHRVAASSSMQTMLHQLMLAAAMIFPLFTCWELHGCSICMHHQHINAFVATHRNAHRAPSFPACFPASAPLPPPLPVHRRVCS
jgi:hypothetical protein